MYDKFFYKSNLEQAKADAIAASKTEFVWLLHEDVDYTNFDLRFVPSRFERSQAHSWPSHNNSQAYTTWLLSKNYKDTNFHNEILPTKSKPKKLQWPNFLTTELNGRDWYDCLCNWLEQELVDDEWVWVCDPRIDYSNFNFAWLPSYFDQNYIHCFTMENKKQLSYTWLVNKHTLKLRQYKFINSNLKFNKNFTDTIIFDMGFNMDSFVYYPKKLRYVNDMMSMLHSAMKRASSEWVWILSSCCNYSNFDFNFMPDLDQLDQAHCWPSFTQTKGETFLIHVPTYLATGEFKFNFDHSMVHRIPWPPCIYEEDNLADALNNNERKSALYTLYYKNTSLLKRIPMPCLWDKRPVVGMNDCNSVSLVPRDCVVKKEIYEYPYLEREVDCAAPSKLDVIFIHNNEKDSNINLNQCHMTMPVDMEFKISSGINGRLAAYKAAAEMSSGDWFLAVFAKCFMLPGFADFKWRPDYWQQAKHYIFYNHNYDLNLTYGHMAPIAYNKRLMLENTGGLDMTLSQEHTVVPIVLSETRLTDPWETWRTSFRETVKLMYYAKTDPSIELHYRLDRWINAAVCWTKHNPWYQYGSKDAVDFFESVDGEWAWIMLTNEWDWLRQKFNTLYPKIPV